MGSREAAMVVSQLTRASRMRTKLQRALEASVLEIEDVSHQHAGHAAMREKANGNCETHFNLKVVSPKFEGQSLVKRHRMSGLHALSIVAKTPQEIVLNPK
ncbi:unnamed protein product [Malus baccata var. baccata]